jgi:hypothetical protein
MFGSNYNDHRERLGWKAKTVEEADVFFYKMATWTEQFAWWPHRCELTKKIIWLQRAYCGHVRWFGYMLTAEYRWHDRHEHLIWVLKGPYGQ